MSIVCQDQNGSPYSTGDIVSIRCAVIAISSQGAGGLVSLTVETPGTLGQRSNVSFAVSPSQIRRMQGGLSQPLPTSASVGSTLFTGDRDVESSPFNVGDIVAVHMLVTSIVGTGAGAVVTGTVENPGNVGGVSGISIAVGPQQTRRATGSISQPLVGA